MNCKIPFTKDILFEKKVCEITSISLEHEITTENDMLKGNFIVSGDYKCHEVSINKEAFSYILPFEIELSEDIDKDTIEFLIDDFNYEVIDNSTLRVNIDFNVIASKKIEEESEEEPLFREVGDLFLDEEEPQELEETYEEVLEEPSETKEEIREVNFEKQVKEVVQSKETEKVSEETIISSLNNTDDDFTTYHIHMVSDGESVETICTMYNSNMSILSEYNDLNNMTSGDKIIIPEYHE